MGKDINPDVKITVPANKKKAIRSALDKLMGINEISLFPDEAGFSQAFSDAPSHTKTETGQAKIAGSYFFGEDNLSALAIEKSLEHYNEVIKLNPKNYLAHNNRGLAFYRNEDYERARFNFNKAIKLNSQDMMVYNNRGNSKYSIGEFGEAIKDYNKAIEINSQESIVYNNLGNAKCAIGKLQESIDDYSQAIELNNNVPEAYYNRGTAQEALGSFQEAKNDYVKAKNLFAQQNRPEDVQRVAKVIDELTSKM